MKIAITGATGFIGGYMVRGLAGAGHDLRLLVRPGREGAVERPQGVGCEIHPGDLTRHESLSGFLKDVDLLVHIAGAHEHLGEEEMRAVNVTGTEALLSEARRQGLDKRESFEIWIVSSAVVGAPVHSYYRDSKRIQEKIIRGSGINWTAFRPTLVYGRGDMRHTAPLLRRCAAGKGSLWIPHDGHSKVNPVHVEDVVDAVLRYFDFDRGVDCCYELAGPLGIAYNQFIDLTIAAVGGKVKRRNIPKKWVDRAIFVKGLFTDVTKDRRASAYFTNATSELGWRPRPYAEGILEVAQGDWWREPVGAAAG
jgi:nucleoside-diphosphate-sugar epimerase